MSHSEDVTNLAKKLMREYSNFIRIMMNAEPSLERETIKDIFLFLKIAKLKQEIEILKKDRK